MKVAANLGFSLVTLIVFQSDGLPYPPILILDFILIPLLPSLTDSFIVIFIVSTKPSDTFAVDSTIPLLVSKEVHASLTESRLNPTS